MLYGDLDKIGQINGTLTQCKLDVCAKTYKNVSMQNNQVSAGATREIPLDYIKTTQKIKKFSPSQPDDEVLDDVYIGDDNFVFLNRILELATASNNWFMYAADYFEATNGNFFELFSRIALVCTSVLQSPVNLNSTNLTGEAYSQEVFVRVRWAWFSGPLALVMLYIFFLGFTVFRSRNHAFIFKTSVLPNFFHGLDGGDGVGYERSLRGEGRETSHDLMRISDVIRVRFGNNGAGTLKLKRE